MAVLSLTEKLNQLGARYDELTQQLSTSEVASDSARYQKVAKQHAELEEIVEKHRQFKQIEKDLAGAREMFIEAEECISKTEPGGGVPRRPARPRHGNARPHSHFRRYRRGPPRSRRNRHQDRSQGLAH